MLAGKLHGMQTDIISISHEYFDENLFLIGLKSLAEILKGQMSYMDIK